MADPSKNEPLDILRDEYKILQDKIDRIGSFRFTIRGWSVTGVIGSYLAGCGVKSLPVSLVSVSVVAALIFFAYFEWKQVKIRNQFIGRAVEVEELIRQNQGDAFVGPLIAQLGRRRRTSKLRWYDFLLPRFLRILPRKIMKFASIWFEADVVFYIAMIILTLAPAFMRAMKAQIILNAPLLHRIELRFPFKGAANE